MLDAGWAKVIWEVLVSVVAGVAAVYAWLGRRAAASAATVHAGLQAERSHSEAGDRRLHQRLDTHQLASDEHYQQLRRDLGQVQARLGVVEENLKHLPTARDLDALQQSISHLGSNVARLEGASAGTTRLLERINQFLLERGAE